MTGSLRNSRQGDRIITHKIYDTPIAAAGSWRDRALLLVLSRTGQRIGDWSEVHGRHGVLGMTLADFDRRTSSMVVRLKGVRDEHRVPVTADFWPVLEEYLRLERGDPATPAAWVGRRRGAGRPLSYAAFEALLRSLGEKLGVAVSAHMFRHTVATALVIKSGVAVAQQVLGHRHVATTVDTYAHVDQAAMIRAVAELEKQATTRAARAPRAANMGAVSRPDRYAFVYDPRTITELEAICTPRLIGEHD